MVSREADGTAFRKKMLKDDEGNGKVGRGEGSRGRQEGGDEWSQPRDGECGREYSEDMI